MTHYNLFATTPKGLELLLVDELKTLGASNVSEKLAGVTFQGDLSVAYKACLWSRLANRILLELSAFPADSEAALYAGVQTIDWSAHFDLGSTFAVHCVCSQSNMTHELFAAQKVKDAIVDQFRSRYNQRPNVERVRPHVVVYVYLYRNKATVSLDLSGESLHRRGYRLISGTAPLKENLAAAILLRAKWPAVAKTGGTLLDPLCGAGTLLIEAAYLAADRAPGLGREYFGFLGWKNHNEAIWQACVREAEERFAAALKTPLPRMVGYDHDPHSIKIAFENIEKAGMRGHVHVEKRDLNCFSPLPSMSPGLVVTNPPYGERLGEVSELKSLYELLGERLKAEFVGWKAAVFTGNPDLGKEMGLRAKHYYALFNGTIPCKLLLFDVEQNYFVERGVAADNIRRIRQAEKSFTKDEQPAIQMFINRVQKNLKHRSRQAQKTAQSTYRLYDADLPEYAFAIDVSETGAVVMEYLAPKTIPADRVVARRHAVLAVLPTLLNLKPEQITYTLLPRKKGDKPT